MPECPAFDVAPVGIRLGTTSSGLHAIFAFIVILLNLAAVPEQAIAHDEKPAATQPPVKIAPPTRLTAEDHPNDAGKSIDLRWNLSPDDAPQIKPRLIRGYKIFRRRADGHDSLPETGKLPKALSQVAFGIEEYTDSLCEPGTGYLYEVMAVGPDEQLSEPARLELPVVGIPQWFDSSRIWFGVILSLVCGSVIFFTEMVKAGRNIHVREIAGLKAIHEAVGRATEMGRPCLFVPGLQDMNEISTVAGINILSHVAKIAADYDATIEVPTMKSLVMTAARETVQAAYLGAGRPDAYSDDRIYYVTEEQFAYVAYLTGYMVREKPAACIYAGTFFAESLILAETGNSVGAIQIAGTAEASQLPFFVAACDYTLIGEELFAAGAYLSGEPHQLGSLKGQDAGKVLAGFLLTAGSLLATAAVLFPQWSAATTALTFLTQTVLGRGGSG